MDPDIAFSLGRPLIAAANVDVFGGGRREKDEDGEGEMNDGEGCDDVFFLVNFFKELGETKFNAVLKKATSTRTSDLPESHEIVLKAIATAHREERGTEKFNEVWGGCLSGARKDKTFSEKTLTSLGEKAAGGNHPPVRAVRRRKHRPGGSEGCRVC